MEPYRSGSPCNLLYFLGRGVRQAKVSYGRTANQPALPRQTFLQEIGETTKMNDSGFPDQGNDLVDTNRTGYVANDRQGPMASEYLEFSFGENSAIDFALGAAGKTFGRKAATNDVKQ